MADVRPAPAPVRRRDRSWTTLWYYLVVIGSFGLLTAVPFLHAATRLRGHRSRWCTASAVLYTAGVIAGIAVAMAFGPGVPALYLVVYVAPLAALVHLTVVRTQIAHAVVDPAVDAVRAGRRRRQQARRTTRRDPAMARELRIGRPDLPRTYDDGGLVDLNSAPAEVIAWACGVDRSVADQLVAARAMAGGPFRSVDDVFSFAEVPVELWDRIRDRAVCVV